MTKKKSLRNPCYSLNHNSPRDAKRVEEIHKLVERLRTLVRKDEFVYIER